VKCKAGAAYVASGDIFYRMVNPADPAIKATAWRLTPLLLSMVEEGDNDFPYTFATALSVLSSCYMPLRITYRAMLAQYFNPNGENPALPVKQPLLTEMYKGCEISPHAVHPEWLPTGFIPFQPGYHP
jgi:hypothetical protein